MISEPGGVAYFDASALVKLCVHEPETTSLANSMLADVGRASSKLAITELGRAVRRVAPSQLSNAARVLDTFALIEVSDSLLVRACDIEPPSVSSPDAIHIASALSLEEDLRVFVTYDRRQAAAAREVGLPVVSPGADS